MTTLFCCFLLVNLPFLVQAQGNGEKGEKSVLMPDGTYKSVTSDDGKEDNDIEKTKLTKAAKWRLKQQKKQEKIARKEFEKAQKQLKKNKKDEGKEAVVKQSNKKEEEQLALKEKKKKVKEPKVKKTKEVGENPTKRKEDKIAQKEAKKKEKEVKVKQSKTPKVVKTSTKTTSTTTTTDQSKESKTNNSSVIMVEESKPIIPGNKKPAKNKKIERSSTECAYAINKIDAFTGKRRLATEPSFFFNHTPDKLKQFMKGKPFMKCTGYIADVGGMRTLNLNFIVDSPNAAKDYGGIEKGAKIYIKLLNGTTVSLYTKESDDGSVDKGKGITEFSTFFVIDPKVERKLRKSEINQMRMIWKVGYEDYEILEIDFIREHLSCLDAAN